MPAFIVPKKPKLIHLVTQGDLFSADLAPENVEYFASTADQVDRMAEIEARERGHELGYVAKVAERAMRLLNLETDTTPEGFAAFELGFFGVEAMAHTVGLHRFDFSLARKRVDEIFLHPPMSDQATIRDLYPNWAAARPNLHATVTRIGEARGSTEPQTNSRLAGAHLAYRLQSPDLELDAA